MQARANSIAWFLGAGPCIPVVLLLSACPDGAAHGASDVAPLPSVVATPTRTEPDASPPPSTEVPGNVSSPTVDTPDEARRKTIAAPAKHAAKSVDAPTTGMKDLPSYCEKHGIRTAVNLESLERAGGTSEFGLDVV